MIDIDRCFSQVLTYAPGAPEPLLVRHIRAAAIEICENTRSWVEAEAFEVTTPDCEALLTIADAAIIDIEDPKLDGQDLAPRTKAWLDEHERGWLTTTEEAVARYITQIAPDTVTIVPRQSGTLTARFILKPSIDALTLPDFLLNHHLELLGLGAAGRVLLTPGEFQNPQLGARHLAEFEGKLPGVKRTATAGQQRAPVRTRTRFF